MMLMSSVVVLLFLGGWLPLFGTGSGSLFWFIFKLLFFCVFFVWVRATLPRYRYDQLMSIGWKIVLPISMAFFIFVNGMLISVTDIFFNKQNNLFSSSVGLFVVEFEFSTFKDITITTTTLSRTRGYTSKKTTSLELFSERSF